jgi:uncharacterized protein YycO
MKILFFRSNTLLSWLIRLLTWSEWSHVALVMDGQVVEAVWPRVRQVPMEVAQRGYVVAEVEIPCHDPATAWAWVVAQEGKPYDWSALPGFLLHRNWENENRWFCSELAAKAFQEGGTPLFRSDCVSRVTPQMLWMLPGVDA